ncbi:hypothetical protein FACS189485_23360 [Spirochaetia bacterium]|nr:hypothetical protein FACS189485_23360 [Spirochaetia bacterium]
MQLLYPKIPKIRVYTDRPVNQFPDGVFVHLEVMLPAIGL